MIISTITRNSIAVRDSLHVSLCCFIRVIQHLQDERSLEIMLKKLTPEKAINIIRLSVALTFCWPLRAANSRTVISGYKAMQICAAINISLLLLPTLYATYLRSDDMEVVSHCVTQALCEIQCIVQTVICFSKHDTLQVSDHSLSLVVFPGKCSML